jgi:hypothetical protein
MDRDLVVTSGHHAGQKSEPCGAQTLDKFPTSENDFMTH